MNRRVRVLAAVLTIRTLYYRLATRQIATVAWREFPENAARESAAPPAGESLAAQGMRRAGKPLGVQLGLLDFSVA